MEVKRSAEELAVFGGPRAFAVPKSTSNLVRPDVEAFLAYSKVFYEQQQFTNNGPLVRMLEERLAALHGTRYCITFCSGFWALVVTIASLALRGKTEVVMPSLTYRRMADVVAWTGLVPHFCDVSPDSLAMTAATAEPALNEHTALILGVHPIVNCCDVDGLVALAEARQVPILFDSVESAYESTRSGKVGKFGNAEVFSMHASKLINGFEGGYVTTNDAALAEVLMLKRGFGFQGPDHIAVAGGLNAKLNEVHAAMALACLDDLEAQVERNRVRYEAYRDQLNTVPGIRLLEFDQAAQTSFKNIVAELTEAWPLSRDDTVRILNAENVLARAYYSPALHRKEMAYAVISGDLPVTDAYAEKLLLLPCGHFVELDDIAAVTQLLALMQGHGSEIMRRLRAMENNLP
jgi:dTDP-4-amino-4,6-dideoxygalactose transaminase